MFGWFKRPPEELPYIPSEEDPEVEADGQTASFIQQKAQIGSRFAKRVGDPNEDGPKQRAHYESVRDDLLAHLATINDDFYRNFASHMLIRMLMDGNDEAVARALLISVNDDDIRERILDDCPVLRLSRMKTPPVKRPKP